MGPVVNTTPAVRTREALLHEEQQANHNPAVALPRAQAAEDGLLHRVEQRPEAQQQRHEPPDGGWGWVVAGGVFLIALVVPMLSPCFGILFSRQLMHWHASSTTVAVIYSAFMVVWKLTGVVLGALAREFGFRRVAMTGTLLTAVCLTLSAFATSPEVLFIFFSLGCGLGSGLSCVGYLILAQYFRKHRGLANTCLMAGAGLGHFFSPLLIRLLQDKYDFVGATIILGAVILHGFVGATLFHPVEWHGRSAKMKKTPHDPEVVSTLLPYTREPENGNLKASDSGCSLSQFRENKWSAVVDQRHVRQAKADQKDLTSLSSVDSVATHAGHEAPYSADRGVSCMCTLCRTITRVLRSIVNDIRILRHPSCLIIALGSTLIVNGEANFTVLVPFAIQAAGHSLQTAAWCVSVAGICNFFTRLSVSAVSDFTWFNMRLCYMAGIATMGVSIIVFTFQTEEAWQAGVMGVCGCAIGIFYGLNNLLMTRIVGLHNLTSMYGAKNFLGALGFFSIGPLIGIIRDASGSYAVSMWVLAGMILASFVLWLFLPASQAFDQRSNENSLPTMTYSVRFKDKDEIKC